MSEESKAFVRSFFETQDREQKTPLEMLTSGFVAHLPGAPPLDAQGFNEREQMFLAGFSNVRHLIEDMVAEDDRVAFRMTLEMTHTGDFMGIPASNQEASMLAMGIMRVDNGKIAEFWGLPDVMSLMQQIGAMPSTSEAGSD